MRVICTAGHVDHGKSTLVEALSGTHPDRWEEEKAREMTIDLGFAWTTLPNDEHIAIVDVPGHEDFIENMLAGVAGLDAFLLVVAADEGIMPQTREHVAILRLMGLTRGVVALTKADLAESEEWLDLVESDLRSFLADHALDDPPIVRVSAKRNTGLEKLRESLVRELEGKAPHDTDSSPVLPIDRVFSVHGFGTVVTGTLGQGILTIGETIEIQPEGLRARIRGLQSHSQAIDMAYPGSRVAVNLVGIDKQAIRRGSVLSAPDGITPSNLIDVTYHHLFEANLPLKHNSKVKIFIGPSESVASVRLLSADVLHPNEDGYLQLRLHSPLPARNGDRFVVRLPSPPQTIGGGIILDSHPERRWKRMDDRIIERFEVLGGDVPARKLAFAIKTAQWPQPVSRFDSGLLDEAIANWDVHRVNDLVLHEDGLRQLIERMAKMLIRFHEENPLLIGMDRDQFLRRLNAPEHAAAVLHILSDFSDIRIDGRFIKVAGYGVVFSKAQRQKIHLLFEKLHEAPFAPPSYKDIVGLLGDEAILQTLIAQQEVVMIPPNVVLRPETYSELLTYTKTQLEAGVVLSVGHLRDHFGSTRRVVLPFLDFLATKGITHRTKDGHALQEAAWERVPGQDGGSE
ncbi:MAG: selenocysteine-specific translation elongation factor [Chloroflexota bacterium]